MSSCRVLINKNENYLLQRWIYESFGIWDWDGAVRSANDRRQERKPLSWVTETSPAPNMLSTEIFLGIGRKWKGPAEFWRNS